MDEKTHAEKSIERVRAVLKSGLTPYRIAKEVGYSSANLVHDLINDKADINSIKVSTAVKFERLYNQIKDK